jgi:IS5 family transposase
LKHIDVAQPFLDKARLSLKTLEDQDLSSVIQKALCAEIKDYMTHADRQIDQIKRRVLQGEKIPHDEKVFSIFEPHTEWVVKGKAGVPVELGLRVCVLEDQHQFLLHHRVMGKETDNQIAIDVVSEAKKRFPALATCSFDKGFHSLNCSIQRHCLVKESCLKKPRHRNHPMSFGVHTKTTLALSQRSTG